MIRRLVLDVMKPHVPDILEMSERLSQLKGVEGVNIVTYEIDKDVENVKVILEGADIEFAGVKRVLEDMGAAIHSVDEVAAGRRIVEEVKTPQDELAERW